MARRRTGQEQDRSAHPHQHVSARRTQSAGWTDRREARRGAGEEDSRSQQGKEMAQDGRGGRKK